MRSMTCRIPACVILVTGLALFLSAPTLDAASRTFPYEATVRTQQVDVRCGPGDGYYVTGRLTQNQSVKVHRHDPGGWYMIAPPTGSFSWIEADLVERQGGNRGIVRISRSTNGQSRRAIVRIGSQLSDAHSYYGRELYDGDSVEILAEQPIHTKHGPVSMYKITPPTLEYRWVKGDYIVAIGEDAQRAQELDPFSVPPSAIQQTTAVENNDPFESITVAPLGGPEVRLSQIDQRYVSMIRQSPQSWNLDALAAEYESLQLEADEATAAKIGERLQAIETRRQILKDYLDVTQTGMAVTEEDASELIALHGGTVEPSTLAPAPTPANVDSPTPTATETPQGDITQQLSGAGILRPVVGTNRPDLTHAITDHSGKVLALIRLSWSGECQSSGTRRSADRCHRRSRHVMRLLVATSYNARQIVRVTLAN